VLMQRIDALPASVEHRARLSAWVNGQSNE
jgi:hypothetical protein